PTFDLCTQDQCGSGLARESARLDSEILNDKTYSSEITPLSIQPSTYSPGIAVTADKRVFGGRDLFSLWFSLGIGLMVLQTGALLAPGLGLSGSLLAIFLGTLVGVLLLAAVGVIGSDT